MKFKVGDNVRISKNPHNEPFITKRMGMKGKIIRFQVMDDSEPPFVLKLERPVSTFDGILGDEAVVWPDEISLVEQQLLFSWVE